MQRDNYTSLSDGVFVGFCTIWWLNNTGTWDKCIFSQLCETLWEVWSITATENEEDGKDFSKQWE
jgi:hypothetical protein